MSVRTYTVEGMTCQHCVNSVTNEIEKTGEISNITVDLEAKTVTVSAGSIDDAAIRAAIDEAGYEVVGQA